MSGDNKDKRKPRPSRLQDRVVETGYVPYTVDRSGEVEGSPRLRPEKPV